MQYVRRKSMEHPDGLLWKNPAAGLRGLRQIARFYIWVIRGTPLLVQLFVIFYGLPSLGVVIDPFPTAVLVFSINEGAYCAEIIRAALESVPAGQMEAGYCAGMSYLQTIRRILLPQAMRTAIDQALSELAADGTLAALSNQYFGTDITQNVQR